MARRRVGKSTEFPSVGSNPPSGPDSPAGSKPNRGGGRSKPSAAAPAPGLYLVATPIGNASDITVRALRVLAEADVIACEDTRVTRKLLAIHAISTPLTPYHEHNAERVRPALIKRLKQGQKVALVSDAGTPLVSDPGYRLVGACIAEGLAVTALPGPSAALAALVVSGLPTDRFLFAGFPPPRAAGRRRLLAELAAVPASLVFMESSRRLAAALADMAEILGQRPAAVARELTKVFEEVRRGSLGELAAHYREAGPPKGEVTVVVAPPGDDPEPDPDEVDRRIRDALAGASLRDAVARVAVDTGLSRRRVYARALALGRGRE